MISVALACYNGEKYIEKQILSIVNQSRRPDEIIVIDDNSTDNTLSIVYDLKIKFPNIVFNIYKNDENLGFVKNFINCLNLCSGEYIFLSDQDDIWKTNKIESMISSISKNKRIKALFCGYECIDEQDNLLNYNYVLNKSFRYNILSKIVRPIKYEYNDFIKSMNIAGMSMCIKREIVNDILKIDSNYITYHDLFLSLLAAIKNGLYYYNEKLVYYRMHTNNTIGLNSAKGKKEDRDIWIDFIIKRQKEMLNCLYSMQSSDKLIEHLNNQITFNNCRKEYLKNKNIISCIKNVFNICRYQSFISFMGDFNWCIKRK